MPVPLIGLIGYVGDPRARCFVRGEVARLAGARMAIVGVAFSAYLTYLELFQIHAICQWCVGSAVVMTLLAIVTTARLMLAPTDRRGAVPYVG